MKDSRPDRRPSIFPGIPRHCRPWIGRAYFPPGELRVGGATGCNRTWTATWEERRGSDRDARCAIAACHPKRSARSLKNQRRIVEEFAITRGMEKPSPLGDMV